MSIVGIYKFIRVLLNLDNISLDDKQIVQIIIYIISYKLKVNIEKTDLLHTELENSIPNFKWFVKKFTLVLNNLIVITNIVFKNDGLVISGLRKMLDIPTILKVLDLITIFTKEQNFGLKKFSFIITEKDQKVLKNIVHHVLKNRGLNETVFTYKTPYDEQRYKKHLDKINNAKIGDILENETIYLYVEYLVIYGEKKDYDNCFVDGDLGDRLDEYENYKLEEISIDDLNLEEWEHDTFFSDIYKEKFLKTKDYPPIVVDSEYSIIDGLHRANALKRSGVEKILAFVGID
jgi:hypothetical protein